VVTAELESERRRSAVRDSEAVRQIADRRKLHAVFALQNLREIVCVRYREFFEKRGTAGGPKMLICCSGRMLLLLRSLLMLASMKLVMSLEDEGLVALTYSVVEEQAAGTEIGDLLVDTGLIAAVKFNRSVIDQIYFSVLPGKHK